MPANRTLALLRTAATLLGATLLVPLLSACPKGDIGAPCNHGDVQAPEAQVVTFPALSCNDLLCVFAQKDEAPKIACKSDAECNTTGAKGLGEPATIPTAAAVANAVHDATGVRVTQAPITPVQLVRLLREQKGRG